MAIKIPYQHKALTLGNLMTLNTISDAFKRVSLVCDVLPSELRKETKETIQNASNQLDLVNEAETSNFKTIIEIEGKEYGMIPDWAKFTTGEWIDLEQYTDDFWNNAHKIMSVLYRAVEQRSGKNYTIRPYTADEDSEHFKSMGAEQFNGCLVFFLNISRKLLSITKSSLVKVVQNQTSSPLSGDGILSSMDSLERTSSKSIQSQNSQSALHSHTLPS